ncbi:hypothetical protein HK100_010088 [Physocladia obscura]|uniref:Methyltransferase domain-containing protein n=1 Tax=Physocladia obscura TaxID=109957 RepID=A0AAD5T3B7_9FUNG|nr:hypothetical protein HK100_010088 [Physocladia obscura]
MGPHQSKAIQTKLDSNEKTLNFSSISPLAKISSLGETTTAETITATVASSGESHQSEDSTAAKKKIAAARVNTLEAKTWNPSNPESWDPGMREYHSLPNSDYVLPTDADEQDRLETQHYILRATFQGDIVCPSVKDLLDGPGVKVLDVGCAKGFWLECIKKQYSFAECHGCDISQTLVEGPARSDGIVLKFGNVLETLPYEDDSFDFVHQRYMVLGMPREKFPTALRELIRVTKSGGWIELVEGDMVMYDAGPHSRTLGTALFDALHGRGLDCYAASNLPYYTQQVSNNVENQQMTTVQFPLNWGASRIGALCGANMKAASLGMEDWMHKAMNISREEYRELLDDCVNEWTESKTYMKTRALYFQVKK